MIRSEVPFQRQFFGFVQLRPEISPQNQFMPNYSPRPQQMCGYLPVRPQYPYYGHNPIQQTPIPNLPTGYTVPSDNPMFRQQQQHSYPVPPPSTYNTTHAVPFQNTQVCQPPMLPPRLPKQIHAGINRPKYVLESPKENVPYEYCLPPRNIVFPNQQRQPIYNPSSNLSLADDRFTTVQPSREHQLSDIPQWAHIPVKELPRDIFKHICTRLDNMPPTGATRNIMDLALRAGYQIEPILNTESLLGIWNPRVSELIEKLQEMECRQLVSEIFGKLKNDPFKIFQPQNSLYPRNMGESKYESNPSQSLQRFETPPIPMRSTSTSYSNASSPPSSSSYSSSPRSITPEICDKPEIYVSYHEGDFEIGEEIVRRVRELGLTVACNDDILPGCSELEGVNTFLKNCKRVIGVITNKYLEDSIPKFEGMSGVLKSVTGTKRTFIPVQVERTDDLPTFFANIKPIKWTSGNKWELLKRSLLEA